ncbi:MAG: hypothetical protein IID33_07335 [Planctomycetes bacterium]|nr:hypothetical protein [Planctomycetota bacterium]
MRNKDARIHALMPSTVVAAFALHAGCMTLEQMAPPVGVEFQRVAQRQHVNLSALELGRQVYLLDCAKCHGVEPIGRYSESRWRKILPRMGKESKLDAQEQAAVNAYVMAAHAFLIQEPPKLVSAEHPGTN